VLLQTHPELLWLVNSLTSLFILSLAHFCCVPHSVPIRLRHDADGFAQPVVYPKARAVKDLTQHKWNRDFVVPAAAMFLEIPMTDDQLKEVCMCVCVCVCVCVCLPSRVHVRICVCQHQDNTSFIELPSLYTHTRALTCVRAQVMLMLLDAISIVGTDELPALV
jgi:hypothetical protein